MLSLKTIIVLLFLFANAYAIRMLVMTGGGAHGAYEAGIIAKMYSGGQDHDMVSGISVGSLNALIVASKSPLNDVSFIPTILEDIWTNISWEDVYYPSLSGKSLLDNTPLMKTIYRYIQKYMINSTDIPFYTGAVNMNTGIFTEWRFGPTYKAINIIPYIMASSSLPVVFPMTKIDNNMYIDGGVLRNIVLTGPIEEALYSSPTSIEIDIISLRNNISQITELNNIIDIAERTFSILYQNIGDVEIECPPNVNITATMYDAPVFDCGLLTFSCCKDMFYDGFNNGMKRTTTITVC